MHIIGVLFIYIRSFGPYVWSYIKYITAVDGVTYKNFGYAVSMSETRNTLMVGTISFWGTAPPGVVYVYHTNFTDKYSFSLKSNLFAPTPTNSDFFGFSIAIGGDAFFISAPGTGDILEIDTLFDCAYLFFCFEYRPRLHLLFYAIEFLDSVWHSERLRHRSFRRYNLLVRIDALRWDVQIVHLYRYLFFALIHFYIL